MQMFSKVTSGISCMSCLEKQITDLKITQSYFMTTELTLAWLVVQKAEMTGK